MRSGSVSFADECERVKRISRIGRVWVEFMKECSGVMKLNERMSDAFEKRKEEGARDVELAYSDYSE